MQMRPTAAGGGARVPLEGGRGKLAEGSSKGPGAEVRERGSAWGGALRGVHRAPPVPPALHYIHTHAHSHTHNHTGTQLTAQHTHSEKHTQPQKHTNTDTEPPHPSTDVHIPILTLCSEADKSGKERNLGVLNPYFGPGMRRELSKSLFNLYKAILRSRGGAPGWLG